MSGRHMRLGPGTVRNQRRARQQLCDRVSTPSGKLPRLRPRRAWQLLLVACTLACAGARGPRDFDIDCPAQHGTLIELRAGDLGEGGPETLNLHQQVIYTPLVLALTRTEP